MRFLLIFLGSFLIAYSSMGADSSSGCGPGKMVAPKQSLISTTTAVGIDYFLAIIKAGATTTGTSGCGKHNLVKLEEPAVFYAWANYDLLQLESSQGHGEFLTGFATHMGCDQFQISSFQSTMQENMEELFPVGADGMELPSKVEEVLKKTNVCGRGNS